MRQTNMITCCSDQLADELVVYFFREQQQHPIYLFLRVLVLLCQSSKDYSQFHFADCACSE